MMRIEEILETYASVGLFLRSFESGSFPGAEWRHAHHLVMAAWYLRRMPFTPALDTIRGGILRFNASAGGANTAEGGYHETLTRFWAHLVRHFLETEGKAMKEVEALRLLVKRFGKKKGLYEEYYSFPLLPESTARWNWMPPDRKPLPEITPDPAPVEWTRGKFLLTTDPAKVDAEAVQGYLSRSYWAEAIPLSVVERSLTRSLSFAVWDGGRQVAYARVVSDRATYAYLCDVFVLEAYRGQGISKWIVESILGHPQLQGLRRWTLVTRDAHPLYRGFGFEVVAKPECYMEIARPRI